MTSPRQRSLPPRSVCSLLILVLLTACSTGQGSSASTPTVSPQPMQQTSPGSSPVAQQPTQQTSPGSSPVATLLAQAPQGCPLGPIPPNCPVSHPTPRNISSDLAPVIGVSPVWATWPAGPSIFHISSPNNYYRPPYGWGMKKEIWEVGPHYTHPVTIRGHDLFSNTPLLIQFLQNAPTADAVLDPQHPNHPISAFGEGWAEWGSYIIVPKAGCYTMEVSWPTGGWSVTFAVGA
jgi:hypothetical protein